MLTAERFPSWAIFTGAVLAASLALGTIIGSRQLNFQLLLVIAFVSLLLIILAAGRRSLALGMVIWVALFVLGYRTIQFTTFFRLHPLVVLIFFLGILFIIQPRLPDIPKLQLSVSIQTLLFIGLILWVNGWLQGLLRGRRWDLMITEALNFLLLPMVFGMVWIVTRQPTMWKALIRTFFGVGSLISALGTLEYAFPELGRFTIAGLIQIDQLVYTAGVTGFQRATFAFWGAPAAAFICLLTLPMVIPCLRWAKNPLAQAAVLGGFILHLIAIYISGYRSLWLLLGLILAVALLSRRNLIVMTFGALLVALGISLVPEQGQERFVHSVEVLQGTAWDGSIETREQRIVTTLQVAFRFPLGVGWGGTGWSHSDFAQVAGNLGLVAGVAFLGWYLLTLLRVWRMQQQNVTDPLLLGLLCSLLAVGGVLLLQGVQVLPQLALPCWFVWAAAHHYAKQSRDKHYAA
ncbi:MAG: hypothetical protein DYG88_12435 [Chloroflexi bacterium CFX4]|nr:hypothetical protein [Chloroflexi bacterium CFX4]MDL1923176.1 hypothetical protein [Chloroflexi bacterium CFX3]